MKYLIKDINEFSNIELNNFYNTIYKQKKDRISKYKNEITKKQGIVGEILLSKLLKKYYNIDYNICTIEENINGKPYITNYNIYFNISHKDNIVICAISKNEIGVDLERVKNINLNTIKVFATKNEQDYILSNQKNIFNRLFKIYTLKEAYIKLHGNSIINIKSFDVLKINTNLISIKQIYYKDFIISIIKRTDN